MNNLNKISICFLSIMALFVYASRLAESVTFYASCDIIQYQEPGQVGYTVNTVYGNEEESGQSEDEALENLRNRLCSFLGAELDSCTLIDCSIDIEYSDELIKNGDFDEGINYWNCSSTANWHVYEYTRGALGKCLYLNGNGISEFPLSVSQDVNVKGEGIIVTFVVKLSNHGSFNRSVKLVLLDSERDKILVDKKVTVTPKWTLFSISGITRHRDTTVRAGIHFYDENPELRIDDASFSAFGRAFYKKR